VQDSTLNSSNSNIKSIQEVIQSKSKDKFQKEILTKFREKFGKDDRIVVEEFPTYYEITVDHPSIEERTGGAECYILDKKTGESRMKWHEHPMKHERFHLDTLKK
jgi:hypothetical protein